MSVTRLTCSSCDEKFRSSDGPGSRVRCPHCGKANRVPEPDEDHLEDEEPAPRKRRDAVASRDRTPPPPGRARRRRDEDEDDPEEGEERPRKRGKGKKEKTGSSLLLWVSLGGGAVVLLAAVGMGVAVMVAMKGSAGTPGGGLGGGLFGPKVYSSPQEVFDAYHDAARRKDAKEVVNCLAPESRREMAAFLAGLAVLVREAPPRDAEEERLKKALAAALDRHGLTSEVVKGIPGMPLLGGKQTEEFNNALLGKVKDPEALLVDLMTASLENPLKDRKFAIPDATLSDVKIDGDRATGTWTVKGKFAQQSKQVEFVKIDGGWKYVYTLKKRKT